MVITVGGRTAVVEKQDVGPAPPGSPDGGEVPSRQLGFRRVAWTALSRSAERARTTTIPTGSPREVLAWISDVERLVPDA